MVFIGYVFVFPDTKSSKKAFLRYNIYSEMLSGTDVSGTDEIEKTNIKEENWYL